MEMVKVMVAVCTLAMSIILSMAADYTVGGANGWSQSTDLQTWASGVTCFVGDNLIFKYTINHDIAEVSKADYDSCTAINPLQPPFNGGSTTIPLTTPGRRYFICQTSGHCITGMKLQIDTLPAATPPPATLPPPPPTTSLVPSPPPPTTSPSVSSPPPPTTNPFVPSPPPPTTSPSVPSPPPPTTSPFVPSPPPPTTSASVPSPPPATTPPMTQPLPPTAGPSLPHSHPTSSPVSSPPSKIVSPSYPPTNSHLPPAAPKVLPSTPPTTGSPALSPAGALPPSASSSATKINVISGFTVVFGSILIIIFNL